MLQQPMPVDGAPSAAVQAASSRRAVLLRGASRHFLPVGARRRHAHHRLNVGQGSRVAASRARRRPGAALARRRQARFQAASLLRRSCAASAPLLSDSSAAASITESTRTIALRRGRDRARQVQQQPELARGGPSGFPAGIGAGQLSTNTSTLGMMLSLCPE